MAVDSRQSTEDEKVVELQGDNVAGDGTTEAKRLNRKSDFRDPKSIVPSLTSGLVIGMLEVALAISFAALIFSGPLARFLPYGIGYFLMGAIIGGTIIALFTSWPGFVGGNQDVPAAILALMAGAIASTMALTATEDEILVTVVVTIALTTLLTGLFFLGTGFFNLGGLARFLPYPVVGGFLAGTGWLLITGAVGLMADQPAALEQLPVLIQPEVIVRWLPGLLLAILFMIMMERIDHYLALPILLVLSLVAFFVIAWIGGYSTADLSAGGWLLGPFSGEGLWQPLTPASLGAVYWPAVLQQAAGIMAIVLVSTVSLLLNASGVELAVDQDIDLDKELRAAGFANILSSLVAGLVGYQQLSFSVLNKKLHADNRLTGLFAVAVCVLTLLAGASLLALFPKVVVGALLLLLGLSFIVEWVIEGWSYLPRVDFVIVITILLVTALVGFLEAVALGLLLAVILFVVGYSQVDIVRHELSGATFRSRVVRTRHMENLLYRHGDEIYILQLQGFIFFGTADSLLRQVRQRLSDGELARPSAVVFDFEHVTGIDSTAVISFDKMKRLAHGRDFDLVICGGNNRVRRQLQRGGLAAADAAVFYQNSIDQGLARCEKNLLARLLADEELVEESKEELAQLFAGQMAQVLEADGEQRQEDSGDLTARIARMISYFERHDLEEGQVFIVQGQPANSLYFLAAGRATARLNMPEGGSVRLETIGGGRVIGEIGFFMGSERTADVLTDEPSTLFRLSRDALARMENEDPAAASLLHRLVADLLAERVIHLTRTVRALER